jgi:hypothetical protein
MKALLLLLTLLAVPLLSIAAEAPADAEAKYTADINKRADDVIKALNLADPAKSATVHEIIVAQYRALRDWHDANGKAMKDKSTPADEKERVAATLKPIHDQFVEKLSKELTPEQVETVKDKLTYNVVHVTYGAYCDELPQLTEPQKAFILQTLKDAREVAMDQGSSQEKHAVFGKAKGKINNYLSKEGYDLKKAEKEWAARRKAAAASKPAAANVKE